MLFTVLGSTVTFSWQGNFELPMNHAQIAKEALNMRIATLSSNIANGLLLDTGKAGELFSRRARCLRFELDRKMPTFITLI